MAEQPRMWSYWRDKKGPVEALEDYFPKTLAGNPQLTAALVQVKSGLQLIESVMTKAEEDDDHG
jgi:hypothetical protein